MNTFCNKNDENRTLLIENDYIHIRFTLCLQMNKDSALNS